ncbi:SatD family protein [Clostridium manihotivorum]|nr:SatD family protein [Clostridium manihotivorum]
MSIYSVINMDIVGSRELTNRVEIQEKLKNYFITLYEDYKNIFVAPITFTLGDEWQLVLRDVKRSYDIFLLIKTFLLKYNIEIYCGIGIGKISTKESDDTREMDGEAFIYARNALISAKATNTFYNKQLYTKDCKIIINGPSTTSNRIQNETYNEYSIGELEVAVTADEDCLELLDLINTLIQNNEMIENNTTDKQKQIIRLYEAFGSYSEIEKAYPGYTRSSISRKLAASNYFLSIHNKEVVKSLLNKYVAVFK